MKISLCMIVKNEADHIERCLESVYQHVDEIIVVDTGSDDDTVQKIHEWQSVHTTDGHAAKLELFFFEWNNDFSAARNFSMDQATGGRIFILDADEYITKNGEMLRQAALNEDFICGTCNVINVIESGFYLGDRIVQPRLFRNEPEIRYKFAIHNQIEDQVRDFNRKYIEETGRQGIVDRTTVEITHTGYQLQREGLSDKYTPRLEMLENQVKIAKESGTPEEEEYYKYQLVLMLTPLVMAEETHPKWKALDYSLLNVQNRWFAHFIACQVAMNVQDHREVYRHVDGMFEAEADRSPMRIAPEAATRMLAGQFFFADGNRRNGIKFMVQAILDNHAPPEGMRIVLDNRKLVKELCAQAEIPFEVVKPFSLPTLLDYMRKLQREQMTEQEIAELMD